jgi:hypothetical protein
MSIQGFIQTMAVADFLQWVQSAKKTGIAVLQQQQTIKELIFENGYLIWGSSNDPREHLGQMALQKNLITLPRFKEVMQLQKKSGVALGEIFLDLQLLNSKQLSELLLEKFSNCFYDLFLWESGRFCFRSEEVEGYKNVFSSRLEVHHLILEGARRFDEWHELRRIFNSSEIQIRTAKKAPEKLETAFDAKLFAQIRAEKRLGHIILEMRLQDYLVLSKLKEWKKKNWIEVVYPEKAATAPLSGEKLSLESPAPELEQAIRLARQEKFEEAHELLNRIEDPMRGREIAELRDELENKLLEIWFKQINLNSILEKNISEQKLAEQGWDAEKMFVFSQLDGQTDTETVIISSPLGEYNTLSILQKLKKADAIRLRKGS